MSRSSQILETTAKTIASAQPRDRGVLVVESDPDLQWKLARMLTVDGNRVVGTASAESALTLIEHWQADLVIIAEKLPRMSGLDLARRLRVRSPEALVILMAEERETPQEESAPTTDIAAFLTKPFRFEALRALIESLQLAPAPAE